MPCQQGIASHPPACYPCRPGPPHPPPPPTIPTLPSFPTSRAALWKGFDTACWLNLCLGGPCQGWPLDVKLIIQLVHVCHWPWQTGLQPSSKVLTVTGFHLGRRFRWLQPVSSAPPTGLEGPLRTHTNTQAHACIQTHCTTSLFSFFFLSVSLLHPSTLFLYSNPLTECRDYTFTYTLVWQNNPSTSDQMYSLTLHSKFIIVDFLMAQPCPLFDWAHFLGPLLSHFVTFSLFYTKFYTLPFFLFDFWESLKTLIHQFLLLWRFYWLCVLIWGVFILIDEKVSTECFWLWDERFMCEKNAHQT